MALRIIAGRLGGRRLETPPGHGTRPTSDRVRQALFDVLGDVTGMKVLDLYAGSGALGIEALSRGAAHTVFVECARGALLCLRKNLAALDIEGAASVVSSRAEAAGRALSGEAPFDLVLIDPPWPKLAASLQALPSSLNHDSLRPRARVVVEHPTRGGAVAVPDVLRLEVAEQRVWGDTAVSIFIVRG